MGDSGSWIGAGADPQVSSAVATGEQSVRVTFSEPMKNNAALSTPANYVITPDGGSVARSVVSVTPEAVTDPTYVDLTLDGEMTIGTLNYNVSVSNVEDVAGNPIDVAHDDTDFDGAGSTPTVVSATSREETIDKVQVVFSEEVKQVSESNPDDALNPANYAIVGDSVVSVLSVAGIDSKKVELTVSGQVAGGSYTVTVSNVEDLADNAVQSPTNDAEYVVIQISGPIVEILPEDGTEGYALDEYVTVNVKDPEEYFSGINLDSWQVYVEYEVNVTGTPQTVRIDAVVDGKLTTFVEGEMSGSAGGYSGITVRFRPWGNSNWPAETDFDVKVTAEDMDGYSTTEESSFSSGSGDVECDYSFMWKLVPEDQRRKDADQEDALRGLINAFRERFEWVCRKTASFPEEIRDPLVCRTRFNENVDVELLTAEVQDGYVTLGVNGDIDEVSKGWILDDGNAEFKVKAVRKYIPGEQDPAEIDIGGEIAPGLGADKVLRQMSLLPFLSADFGLDLDEYEVEGYQRSSVANAVQWLGMKGSERSYEIRGLISGFEVSVYPLYRIPVSMTELLPIGTYWQVDGEYYTRVQPLLPKFDEIQGDSGLLDTFCWEGLAPFEMAKTVAGVSAVSGGWRVTLHVLEADLRPMLLAGNWKVVDSRDDSEVLAVGDGSEDEYDVAVEKPVIAPGTLVVEYTSGSVTKTITDDGFGVLQGDVDTGGVNEVDYESGRLQFKCSGVPDNATDIEATYKREFWIERFDDSGSPAWLEVGPYTSGPKIGLSSTFYLRYVCQEAEECWFCKTAKLRVKIEAGTILDDPGADIGSALPRMVQKLQDVVPAHVEIVQAVYKTYVEAEVPYTVDVDLFPLGRVFAPMRDQFDGITGDE